MPQKEALAMGRADAKLTRPKRAAEMVPGLRSWALSTPYETAISLDPPWLDSRPRPQRRAAARRAGQRPLRALPLAKGPQGGLEEPVALDHDVSIGARPRGRRHLWGVRLDAPRYRPPPAGRRSSRRGKNRYFAAS